MVTATAPALGDFSWAVVWIGLRSVRIFTSAAYELQEEEMACVRARCVQCGQGLKALCASASDRILSVSSVCSLLPSGTSKSV